MSSRARSVIPGFGLSMGYTVSYLTLLVLLPLAALAVKSARLDWATFKATVTDDAALAAYRLTFGASLVASVVNAVFGLIVAWVLVRYAFPGRRVFNALVDFPFALPTAVAGLTFSQMLSPAGWLGGLGLGDKLRGGVAWAAGLVGLPGPGPTAFDWLNLQLNATNAGVVVVLVFVGLPFVVRTVQPVLQDWDAEYEQAAASLGAGRVRTFVRVIFPALYPAWLSGIALAFARAVGEYGSVVFIAANSRRDGSQIAPVLIVENLNNLESDGVPRAVAIAVVLLLTSLVVLLLLNGLEWWSRRHER